MKHFTWALPLSAFVGLISLYFGGTDVARLRPAADSVTYTDRNGTVLGTILGANSSHVVSVPLSLVSPAFLQAIVAAEDARFWKHGAIDVPALIRAARDFAILGQARSGGSTLEMQLARLIDDKPSFGSARDDTISAQLLTKLRQIMQAERIAIVSSKAAILQGYVNHVPMGGNVYGVEAAARMYFGEPAADLDVAQSALLAAIPNDPTRLAPGEDAEALRARQRFILERMARLGYITPVQADLAFAETLHLRRHDFGIADAPHALFFLAGQRSGSQGRVRTTIDRSLQRFVQAQTQDVIAALQRYHVTGGAALVADNRSGDVLAYVGSPDYFGEAALGSNDGVQALRQPGSSLKPFTYELALERGTIDTTTILSDAPASYAITGGKLYQPADYSGRFSGPVRIRYALANSLNAPAVQVLSGLGVAALLDRLHEAGFSHLGRPASYYGLGLTLGSGEVSLWELVQAYATIARDGEYIPLQLVDREHPPAVTIGQPAYWQLVTDMLADPYARAKSFGIGSVLQMPFPAAVKTGTSSDFRDTWTVGFTRDYTVGAWVGNFDGSPMRGVSGVAGAAPLWNRIMLHLYERNAEPPPFPKPRGFIQAAICATTGRAPSRAACPGIVQEWVLARDLPAIRRADVGPSLQIVFPHEGDVFVRIAAASALASHEQELALRAEDAGGRVHWTAGGTSIALDANGTAFWPLQLGTWRISASDGTHRQTVTIHVVPPPQRDKPGFTFGSHAQ